MSAKSLGPIVRDLSIRYRFPVQFPDVLSIGSTVSDIQADRFVMSHQLVSQRLQKVAAEVKGTLVCVDYAKGGIKANLPQSVSRALQLFEESKQKAAAGQSS